MKSKFKFFKNYQKYLAYFLINYFLQYASLSIGIQIFKINITLIQGLGLNLFNTIFTFIFLFIISIFLLRGDKEKETKKGDNKIV